MSRRLAGSGTTAFWTTDPLKPAESWALRKKLRVAVMVTNGPVPKNVFVAENGPQLEVDAGAAVYAVRFRRLDAPELLADVARRGRVCQRSTCDEPPARRRPPPDLIYTLLL